MYKIPLSDIKQKILAGGKLSRRTIRTEAKGKNQRIIVSDQRGRAAHIIANELGVELVSLSNKKLKIKEVYAGMRNITAVGKVVRKFEVRNFLKIIAPARYVR